MAYTTIDKPTDYFETVLYTGTGSTQSITSLDFQPDWVWGKTRNDTQDHQIIDSVRGATKLLATNGTAAEFTDTNNLTSFNSNGFTVGSSGGINGSSDTLVTWNWKAGGTAVSNTDGSITSSVSANQTAGFSIVSYTGTGSAATVGHGLGSDLKMVIIKNRDAADNWEVYHSSVITSDNQTLNLDNSNAVFTRGTASWDISEFSSSVIGLNTNSAVNSSSVNYIAYCFAEKQGFSKISSYIGNGSTDGTFIYTGFKPAFVMFKNATTASTNWHIVDDKRDTFNIVDKLLLPNEPGAEITQSALDLTSNGFKIRVTNGFVNTSGNNYIYMAFAENPFVSSTGVPSTAR